MSIVTETRFEADQNLLLPNVSWEQYLAVTDALSDRPSLRTSYDGLDLELMVKSRRHEWSKQFLSQLITLLAIELDIPISSGGEMTIRREDLQKGLEPDQCYWITHEPQVRGRMELDLSVDPPPDLAVEIDVANSSLDRMSIYAAFGVPEIWRYDGSALQACRLESGVYRQSTQSQAFPFLAVCELLPFLEPQKERSETSQLRDFIEWVRSRNWQV